MTTEVARPVVQIIDSDEKNVGLRLSGGETA
jgi:hypothetical protein